MSSKYSLAAVLAVHRRQDPVRAGLHRQMQVGHQLGDIAVGCDQVVVHVARMAGGVADALDAIDCRQGLDQAGQPAPFVALAVIGIDVLAEQRDLADAGVRLAARFGKDRRQRPGDLRAARIGHHAEGAELVAAFLDGEKGGRPGLAQAGRRGGRQMIELVLERKLGLHDGAIAGITQDLGQAVIGLRPDHHVDDGRPADDLLRPRPGRRSRPRRSSCPCRPSGAPPSRARMRPISE